MSKCDHDPQKWVHEEVDGQDYYDCSCGEFMQVG